MQGLGAAYGREPDSAPRVLLMNKYIFLMHYKYYVRFPARQSRNQRD
jgi:hypothetical protein